MLYQRRYRVESARYKNWNYAKDGFYFVTICTQNRVSVFGKIDNGQVILSELGKYAEKCWHEITKHFKFVNLEEYIIMPNHVHGIIEIAYTMETQNIASLQSIICSIPNRVSEKFGPQSGNLASIIRGFKAGVTIWAKFNNMPFQWQHGYYDHIVSRELELNKIRDYIRSNPINWDKDKYNPEKRMINNDL